MARVVVGARGLWPVGLPGSRTTSSGGAGLQVGGRGTGTGEGAVEQTTQLAGTSGVYLADIRNMPLDMGKQCRWNGPETAQCVDLSDDMGAVLRGYIKGIPNKNPHDGLRFVRPAESNFVKLPSVRVGYLPAKMRYALRDPLSRDEQVV